MKKAFSLLLIIAILFSMVGCQEKSNTNVNDTNSNSLVNQDNDSIDNSVSNNTQNNQNNQENQEINDVVIPHSDKFKVEDDMVSFVDQLGREVKIAQNPKSVVAISYNALDLWYGAGGTAVLRTDHPLVYSRKDDELTKVIKELPIMNGPHEPVNLEILLEKEPDLVIITPGPMAKFAMDIIPTLDEYEIPYFAWSYTTFEEFLEEYELFCLLNDRMDLYEEVARENIVRVEAVRNKIKDKEPIEMVMLIPSADKGAIALTNMGYLGNICEDMNTINIAFEGEEEPKSGVISMEKLIEIDPTFILSRGGSGDGSKENAIDIFSKSPLWENLTAIKEGKYDHLPAELFLYEPNTRFAEAYEYLGKLLYPNLFE